MPYWGLMMLQSQILALLAFLEQLTCYNEQWSVSVLESTKWHCQSPKSMIRKFEMEEGRDDHSSVNDYDNEDDMKTFRLNTSSITF